MAFKQTLYNSILNFAKWLGFSPQDSRNREHPAILSAQDMMTIKLSNMVANDFSLPIDGDSARALWMDGLADDFTQTKLRTVIKRAFDTGDCLVVPSWTDGGVMENIIVDGDSFVITGAYGDKLTGIAYRADYTYLNGVTYELMVSLTLEGGSCIYRAYVSCDGALGAPLSTVPKWADYLPEWGITNVDRLLVGRMKSPACDDRDPNTVKGTPICYRAQKPIAEIDYLTQQLHDEVELSEKFVRMPKRWFNKTKQSKRVRNADGTYSTEDIAVLPKGHERVIMATSGGADVAAVEQPFVYSPDIREDHIINALEEQYRLFENAVGVSPGVLSKMNSDTYSNVDNVRKSSVNTQSFINAARKQAESCIDDMLYTWDVLASYYNIVPIGNWESGFDWSDEYINTFSDHMNGLVSGYGIGAVSAEDFREWFFREPPDVAAQAVADIKAANIV